MEQSRLRVLDTGGCDIAIVGSSSEDVVGAVVRRKQRG